MGPVILFSASATSAPPMSPMYGLGLGLRVRIDIADVADALNSITRMGLLYQGAPLSDDLE